MSKDDEDVLPGLGSGDGVDKELIDLGVVHVEVSSKDSPEDSLEGRHSKSIDGSGDELEVVASCEAGVGGSLVVGLTFEERDGSFVIEGGADLGLTTFGLQEREGRRRREEEEMGRDERRRAKEGRRVRSRLSRGDTRTPILPSRAALTSLNKCDPALTCWKKTAVSLNTHFASSNSLCFLTRASQLAFI